MDGESVDTNPHRPFCSPTRRRVDLGAGLDEGSYRVTSAGHADVP